MIAGCVNPGWVGDGYCDDSTNNMECNYDGGDCCGPNINTQYCVECQCQNGNGTTLTTTISPVSTTTWNGILEGNLYQKSNNKDFFSFWAIRDKKI